ELRWTPDAQSLLYTRGADLEGGDSDPNPRSNPAGPEHAIWMVAASGGEPRKLAEGRGTAVSPRGDVAAYLKEGQVWSAPLDGKEKPAQLIHAHGQASALRWSPDGARLAFVSGRKDHGYIGVYTLADKSLRFLDPSVDRDSNPVWSPDGARIAFVRIAASSLAFAFGPRREGQPWSIHVAEVTTGQGREVWRAREGRGSVFHQIVAENQLFWAAGDRIIFPWEGDGWLHLYSVPAAGGAADLLTPGGFEVEHVSLTPGGREVIYSSNQDDIDRRHIWRARFDRGKPAAVTRGTGIEWSPVVSSDGKTIVVLHSDARRPARAALLTAAGEARDLAPDSMPADFPAGALVEPQQVIFSASDGLAIHGQ